MRCHPSKAHRWVGGGCTASVAAEHYAIRAEPPSAAAEGIKWHAEAARCLRGDLGEHDALLDVYLRDVTGSGVAAHVEHRVEAKGLTGAIDAYGVQEDGTVIIWDLKMGYEPVEVVENWQLLCYGYMLDAPRLDLRIVQPRAIDGDAPVRQWIVDDPAPYYQRIQDAIARVRSPDARYVATSGNCRRCDALTTCPAVRRASLWAFDYARRPTKRIAASAMRDELDAMREAKRLVTIRLDALEAEAIARLRNGEPLLGCRMKPGKRAPLRWSADNDIVESVLGLLPGPGLRAPAKLVTPKQAIDAGYPAEVVEKLATRGATSLQLSTDAAEYLRKTFNE